MKKMNAFIAALALALTAATPLAASAATEHKDAKSVAMDVSRTYTTSYTLHLPDQTPKLDEKPVDVNFGVTAYLEYNQKLTVNVTSLNKWNLKDAAAGSDATVSYKLFASEKDLTGGDNAFMNVTDFDNNESVYTTLTFKDFGKAAYAGTYKDTLTFAVSVEAMADAEERAAAEAAANERKEARKEAEEAAKKAAEEAANAAEETTTPVDAENNNPTTSTEVETPTTPTGDDDTQPTSTVDDTQTPPTTPVVEGGESQE